MKIFRLIGLFLVGSGTLFSCSNNEDELLSKEQEENEQETYTISFDLGGEFISTSETPLSRTEVISKKIYGINVYYKKDDNSSYQNYAYGLFDNIEDMTISLIGGYKYKFECSMVKNDVDTLYYKQQISGNIEYYAPFHKNYVNGYYSGVTLENKFNISTTTYARFVGLREGTINIDDRSGICRYPKTDRFYGELTDYVPTKEGVAKIDLKRTAFGFKFVVTPPTDGTLSVDSYSINPNIKISSNEDTVEMSSMYTFYDVYRCWEVEKYTEDFTIKLTWVRGNGATQTFEKVVTAKRNVMTTININVNGSSTESSLGIKEEDTPMGSENVDMNFDGGDLDDNEVNPSK